MADYRIADQDLSGRRGMLLGMTLAEVMLIILFCLLLLLGKYAADLKDEKSRSNLYAQLERIAWIKNLKPEEIANLDELLQEIDTYRNEGEQLSDVWKRLTDKLKEMEQKLVAAGGEEDWQARAQTAEQRAAVLKEELVRAKAGSPPPCLFERSVTADKLRGPSIKLGVLHLEDGTVTLVSRNAQIPELSPVDFLGQPADYEEAYKQLVNWPAGQPMSIAEFKRYAQGFKAIGDSEVGGKLKCMFTMDFYKGEDVPDDMYFSVFSGYFLKQSKLTLSEFKQIN